MQNLTVTPYNHFTQENAEAAFLIYRKTLIFNRRSNKNRSSGFTIMSRQRRYGGRKANDIRFANLCLHTLATNLYSELCSLCEKMYFSLFQSCQLCWHKHGEECCFAASPLYGRFFLCELVHTVNWSFHSHFFH